MRRSRIGRWNVSKSIGANEARFERKRQCYKMCCRCRGIAQTTAMRGGRISAFGFTLIELLTVVAIIAIIAAMMMPVLSRARATADDTKCASNLRQIGMGILSYARDHDGSLPGRTSPDWTSQPHGILLGVYAYSWAGGNDPFGLQW